MFALLTKTQLIMFSKFGLDVPTEPSWPAVCLGGHCWVTVLPSSALQFEQASHWDQKARNSIPAVFSFSCIREEYIQREINTEIQLRWTLFLNKIRAQRNQILPLIQLLLQEILFLFIHSFTHRNSLIFCIKKPFFRG